jgi:hypothetical protein
LAALCWSKSKRLKVPRARRRPALPIPIHIEPGCPARHPRSTPRLRASKPWAYRCWLFETARCRQSVIPTPSWPALCRPSRPDERRASIHRDHRHKPGDDGGGCSRRVRGLRVRGPNGASRSGSVKTSPAPSSRGRLSGGRILTADGSDGDVTRLALSWYVADPASHSAADPGSPLTLRPG